MINLRKDTSGGIDGVIVSAMAVFSAAEVAAAQEWWFHAAVVDDVPGRIYLTQPPARSTMKIVAIPQPPPGDAYFRGYGAIEIGPLAATEADGTAVLWPRVLLELVGPVVANMPLRVIAQIRQASGPAQKIEAWSYS